MNWSAEDFGLVPTGVVTMMSTVPAAPAGDVAVIWVALLTVKLVAGALPNTTAAAPVKFAPVMVTTVPPASGPLLGFTRVTAGPACTPGVSVTVIGSLIVGIVTVNDGGAGGGVLLPAPWSGIDCE